VVSKHIFGDMAALGLTQGKNKVSLIHFVLPESKQALKKWRHVIRNQEPVLGQFIRKDDEYN
jgi:hypothetical protein